MSMLYPHRSLKMREALEAKGSTIWTTDGHRILDGCSGAIACSIGHGNEYVASEMAKQAAALSFSYRTQFRNSPCEKLAARLTKRLGYASAFFVNSGSEAVEAAVRTAQQYWQAKGQSAKFIILSRKLSYHGSTGASLALSGHWTRRRSVVGLSTRPTLPTPYCYRSTFPESPQDYGYRCAKALETEIGELGASNVAAFLLEPITGASGAAIVPPSGYLEEVAAICNRNDVLLIVDEVLTGLGRAGYWLAQELGNVKADIVCVGKGLNAGYWPISAILLSAEITSVISDVPGGYNYGHTHSGHPVGAAVANAVLDILEGECLVERTLQSGRIIRDQLTDLTKDNPFIGEVRGSGHFWGLELVKDRATRETFTPTMNASGRFVNDALDKGLLLYPSVGFAAQHHGDAIIFAPSLNTSPDDFMQMIEILSKTVKDYRPE